MFFNSSKIKTQALHHLKGMDRDHFLGRVMLTFFTPSLKPISEKELNWSSHFIKRNIIHVSPEEIKTQEPKFLNAYAHSADPFYGMKPSLLMKALYDARTHEYDHHYKHVGLALHLMKEINALTISDHHFHKFYDHFKMYGGIHSVFDLIAALLEYSGHGEGEDFSYRFQPDPSAFLED
ncbi:hypothetical protein [Endozoicomonas sp.]|uniref:hypothetical protein n=1 Tax=Endozoicomonas sp. TaxID=1892382 RepID=UPI00383AA740